MFNLVRVSKIKDLPFELPFKPQTFYKMWHMGRNLQIFIKLGGSLFIDIQKLEELIEGSRGQRKAE